MVDHHSSVNGSDDLSLQLCRRADGYSQPRYPFMYLAVDFIDISVHF
jgi:hypothetical protein